jgi:hypothetical protein
VNNIKSKRPSFWGTVRRSWVAVALVLVRMPRLVVSALALNLSLTWMLNHFYRTDVGSETFQSGTAKAIAIVFQSLETGLVMAPLVVGITRLLVLGERRDAFVWSWRPEVRSAFFLSTLLDGLPFALSAWVPLKLPSHGGMSSLMQLAILLSSCIAAYVPIRFVLVLPATAIDSLRLDFRKAWQATRGCFWYVMAVIWITIAPVLALTLMSTIYIGGGIASGLMYFVEFVFPACVYALLYQSFSRTNHLYRAV